MLYTGSVSDRCAITFTDVKELHNPVGFNSSHAFECDNLLRWLRMGKMTNPITAEAIASESLAIEVLSPLVINGDRRLCINLKDVMPARVCFKLVADEAAAAEVSHSLHRRRPPLRGPPRLLA